MKLALECPTAILREVQPLTDFDFILCHRVLGDNIYRKHFAESNRVKMLDNSVNELGTPTTVDDLKKAADWVHPDYIIAPDVLWNSEATLGGVEEAVKCFSQKAVIPVVQGSDINDCLWCASKLQNFSTIALPYRGYHRGPEAVAMSVARTHVFSSIIENMKFGAIHLLGMSTLEELEGIIKIASFRKWPFRLSIDTGRPITQALENKVMSEPLDKSYRSEKKWDNFSDQAEYVFYLEQIYYNIAYLRKVLNC